MMHSPNWLEEPVFGTTFRSNKGKKLIYRRGFQKQPLDSKSYSLYAAKKHIATNHEHQLQSCDPWKLRKFTFTQAED
jgi:hypothetical protein